MNVQSNEKGQNLVFVALMMIVFIGILALVIDGGYGYAKRREAQNAADAGALAGANAMCAEDPRPDLADDYAWDYAVNRNGAVNADVITATHAVTVTTYFPYRTFFAGVLGTDVVTATATAAAGCYSPCQGTGVMPVAWACQPPIGEPGSEECVIQYGTMDDPGPLYVIMDSRDLNNDFYCQEPPNSGTPVGALDCDLNNDGYDDMMAGGDRSWLDLNGGGGGASELNNWISNGFGGDVFIHTWFSGQSGVENSTFQAAADREGDVLLLPVFNDYCDGQPDTTAACIPRVHPEDTIIYGTSQTYFHVINYSAFLLTCVDAPGTPNFHNCPGKAAAIAANPGAVRENTKTIEGYFIEGYNPNLGGRCDNPTTGTFTIFLRK